MVQEPDTLSQAARQDSQDADFPPIEIEDSTPEDVLAQEDSFFSTGDASERYADEADDGTPSEEPGTEVASTETDLQGTQTGRQPQPVAESQETEPPEPPQRVRSEEEWRKMQSAYDRQIAEQNKRLRDLEERAQRQQVETQVEAELQRQEQQLAQSVGTEEARRLVRDKTNQDAVREALQARVELETMRTERNQYQQQSRVSVMQNWVGQLKSQYSLTDDDVSVLASTVNPAILQNDEAFVQTGEALGRLAQRLGNTSKQRTVATEERKNLVPRETPETALESGQSISHAPPNDEARAQAIMDKPGWEWTDEEAKFMRRR